MLLMLMMSSLMSSMLMRLLFVMSLILVMSSLMFDVVGNVDVDLDDVDVDVAVAVSQEVGPSVIVLPQPRDFVELLSERLHALDADELEEEGDRFQCFKFDEELTCEVNDPFLSTDTDSDSSDDSGVTYFALQRQRQRQRRSVRWEVHGDEGG